MKDLFALCLSLLTLSSFAQQTDPGRYRIEVGDPTTSTVTEKSFNTIPLIINSQHSQDFKKFKIKTKVNTYWEKPFFTAWVQELAPKDYSINFWGGVTRIPGMNDNGLALFACHEVGHLLGGKPRSKIKNFLWASAEGQSDYFATSICLKKYFANKAKRGQLEEPKINRKLYTRCVTKYPETQDFLICTNIMSAIEAFARVLNHIDPEKPKINLFKISPAAKETMYNSYPEGQCRIETLRAGNFCAPQDYPCQEKDNIRPQCWFVD